MILLVDHRRCANITSWLLRPAVLVIQIESIQIDLNICIIYIIDMYRTVVGLSLIWYSGYI